MSISSVRCFPKSDLLSGRLVLDETKEELSWPLCIVAVVSSTAIYPVVFTVALVAECYLFANLCYHNYKHWKVERKLKDMSNEKGDELSKYLSLRRVTKLTNRQDKQKVAMEKALNCEKETSKDSLSQSQMIKDVKSNYEDIKSDYENAIDSDKYIHACRLAFVEDKVKIIRQYERTQAELRAISSLESTPQIKDWKLKRLKFSKIKHELNAKVDKSFLSNLMMVQIPIIGMIWLARSKSTKAYLEKSPDLLGEYDQLISANSWLKPY